MLSLEAWTEVAWIFFFHQGFVKKYQFVDVQDFQMLSILDLKQILLSLSEPTQTTLVQLPQSKGSSASWLQISGPAQKDPPHPGSSS